MLNVAVPCSHPTLPVLYLLSDLVNKSVPHPPLCQSKLSLQLDIDGALVPIPTAVTKSLCSGLVHAKHGAVLIHVLIILLKLFSL